MVFVASPVLLKPVVVVVPICAQLVQLLPSQRSTRYSATPTLSVAATQERSIRLVLSTVAASPVGGVGGDVSGAASVVTSAIVEYCLRLPERSDARTRYRYVVEPASPVSVNEFV